MALRGCNTSIGVVENAAVVLADAEANLQQQEAATLSEVSVGAAARRPDHALTHSASTANRSGVGSLVARAAQGGGRRLCAGSAPFAGSGGLD